MKYQMPTVEAGYFSVKLTHWWASQNNDGARCWQDVRMKAGEGDGQFSASLLVADYLWIQSFSDESLWNYLVYNSHCRSAR